MVGVATLAITRLYEQLLARGLDAVDVDACVSAWRDADAVEAEIRHTFAGTDFVETAVTETRAKHVSAEELRNQLATLHSRWPEIRERISQQLVPSTEIKRWLELVGAPTEPEQIGISRQRLRTTFHRAYHIRRRFTVLDVAVRTRTLDSLLEGLFGPGGVWQIV
jgi:glycerol-1-phosphate dehydrogenase [NAD(P)+]